MGSCGRASVGSCPFIFLQFCQLRPRNKYLAVWNFKLRQMQSTEARTTRPNVTSSPTFPGKTDRYSGITVNTSQLTYSVEEFENVLKASLSTWRENGTRGVWFRIPLSKSSYVPLLAQHGFQFHHGKPSYVMMTRWLPENEPNLIPSYPHTNIGVAGLVVNDKDEILVIKEKYHTNPKWKFPGGYANPGEEFAETAAREVLEETGVISEFVSIVGQRHRHHCQFDCGDLYVVCHMKPLTLEITEGVDEIADCQWMPLKEFEDDPETIDLNRSFVRYFIKSREMKVAFAPSLVQSPVSDKLENVYHLKHM